MTDVSTLTSEIPVPIRPPVRPVAANRAAAKARKARSTENASADASQGSEDQSLFDSVWRTLGAIRAFAAGRDVRSDDQSDGASDTANQGQATWLDTLRKLVTGLRKEDGAASAGEVERIVAAAEMLGVRPILSAEDLKYQGVQSLGNRHGQLANWVHQHGGDRMCVRVRMGEEGAVSKCWIITSEPNSTEVEAARNLILLKGWDVEIHPATRAMVDLAVGQDQTLTPTEVEDTFRDILRQALARNASDVHFEVRGDRGVTRFRVNGEMQEFRLGGIAFPRQMIIMIGNYLFNRLAKRGARQFVISRPLNASAQTKVDDQTVALRFATAPDIRGVDIFVRIWRPDGDALKLEDLGYRPEHIGMLREAISRPYGVIVFSGPTGSGKSSALTALLDDLPLAERQRRKIISLEEPVERELDHVTHVSVSNIIDEGGWKSLLGGLNRWDSNINVLGEIKDAETADAIQDLATSGKLTLTTIHAANVLSIPARMEDLGVDHKLLFDRNFLVLLVNQRLVPRLCSDCRVPISDRARLAKLFEQKKLDDEGAVEGWRARVDRYRTVAGDGVHLRGDGCAACRQTGIVGRVLVGELVMMDDPSRQYVRERDWDGWQDHLEATGWASIRGQAVDYVGAGMVDPMDVEKLVCRLDRAP